MVSLNDDRTVSDAYRDGFRWPVLVLMAWDAGLIAGGCALVVTLIKWLQGPGAQKLLAGLFGG